MTHHLQTTALMGGTSVTTVMATLRVRKRNVCAVVNLAWRKKCGAGEQLVL
jgi:hypothetical protein